MSSNGSEGAENATKEFYENTYMQKDQISRVIPWISFAVNDGTVADGGKGQEFHIDGVQLEMVGDGTSTWATEPGDFEYPSMQKDEISKVIPWIEFTRTTSPSTTQYNVDGILLEEVAEGVTEPSTFNPWPSDSFASTGINFKTIVINYVQNLQYDQIDY